MNKEKIGRCEVCGTDLHAGDTGFSYDDGPLLCEQHAPTWADIRGEAAVTVWDTGRDPEDVERARTFLASCLEREERGMSLGDRYAHTL